MTVFFASQNLLSLYLVHAKLGSVLSGVNTFPAMASKSIFNCVTLLVVLCFLLMAEPSDCSTAYGCFGTNAAAGLKEIGNRKVLAALKDKQTTLKASRGGSSSSKYGEKSQSWELRKVPSGPDPLHHHGGSPQKPRTP